MAEIVALGRSTLGCLSRSVLVLRGPLRSTGHHHGHDARRELAFSLSSFQARRQLIVSAPRASTQS